MTRRAIRFEGLDTEFELSKVTAINRDIPVLFLLEELKDKTYRLTYNAVKITDLSKVSGLTIIRED